MADSSFGFEKPEDSPGLLLWQTTISWQRLIKKALLEYGISHSQFVILAILLWFTEQGEQPTQVMIIDISKLDKMIVSQSLKKLSAQGLIQRQEHETDTRAKTVKLTHQGKALTAKLVGIVEKIDADFFGKLKSKEHHSLLNILGSLMAKNKS